MVAPLRFDFSFAHVFSCRHARKVNQVAILSTIDSVHLAHSNLSFNNLSDLVFHYRCVCGGEWMCFLVMDECIYVWVRFCEVIHACITVPS